MSKFQFNQTNLRESQETALTAFLEDIEKGRNESPHVLPPREGKSHLIRMQGLEAKALGFSLQLIYTPFVQLRKQGVSRQDERQFKELFDVACPKSGELDSVSVFNDRNWKANGEFAYYVSPQFFTETGRLNDDSRRKLMMLSQRIMREAGRVLVSIDEIQYWKKKQGWGEIYNTLKECGCMMTGLTGTPYSDDEICCFDYDRVDQEEYIRTLCRFIGVDEDRGKVLFEKQDEEGIKETYVLKSPSSYYPLSKSFSSGSVCRGKRIKVDIKVTTKRGEKKPLMECSESEAKDILGHVCRDDTMIAQCIEHAGAQPIKRGIMVFSQPFDQDIDASRVGHAEAIRDEIKRQFPNDRVEIASPGDERPAEIARCQDILKATKDGEVDWLIVKQLGGVGFNCPWIKTKINLTTRRTPNDYIQTTLRPATPDYERDAERAGKVEFTVIEPADPMSEKLWETYFSAAGGDVSDHRYDVREGRAVGEVVEEESDLKEDLRDVNTLLASSFSENPEWLRAFVLGEGYTEILDAVGPAQFCEMFGAYQANTAYWNSIFAGEAPESGDTTTEEEKTGREYQKSVSKSLYEMVNTLVGKAKLYSRTNEEPGPHKIAGYLIKELCGVSNVQFTQSKPDCSRVDADYHKLEAGLAVLNIPRAVALLKERMNNAA